MNSKKYELVKTDREDDLFQIRALRDIPERGVSTGDLGGFVQSEANLSHEGSCWIADQAQVYESAWVCRDAQVDGSAQVYGEAQVYGYARVEGSARIYEHARVMNQAQVSGSACIGGQAQVYGSAQIEGDTQMWGEAQIHGSARISGNVVILNNVQIGGNVIVQGPDTDIEPGIYLSGWLVIVGKSKVTRTPIHITGLSRDKIVVTDNRVQIGCESHTLGYWLKHYKTVGRNNAYTPKDIRDYRKVLTFIKQIER